MPLIVSICSLVGLITFFVFKPLFMICGLVGLFGSVLYGIGFTKNKDQIKIAQLIETSESEEDASAKLRQFKLVNAISRLITYGVVMGVIYYFFKLKGFAWLGIVFGLGYIPEMFKIFSNHQSLRE